MEERHRLHLSSGASCVIVDGSEEYLSAEYIPVQDFHELVVECDVLPFETSAADSPKNNVFKLIVSCYDEDKEKIWWLHSMAVRSEAILITDFVLDADGRSLVLKLDRNFPSSHKSISFFTGLDQVETVKPFKIFYNAADRVRQYEVVDSRTLRVGSIEKPWTEAEIRKLLPGKAVLYAEPDIQGQSWVVPIFEKVFSIGEWIHCRGSVFGYGRALEFNGSRFRNGTKFIRIGIKNTVTNGALPSSSFAVSSLVYSWAKRYE